MAGLPLGPSEDLIWGPLQPAFSISSGSRCPCPSSLGWGQGEEAIAIDAWPLTGGCPHVSTCMLSGGNVKSAPELGSPSDLSPHWAGAKPAQFSVSGELDSGVQKACRT